MSSTQCVQALATTVAEIEDEFAYAVVEGLSRPKKSLPCRYLYDARGSELFDAITRLPEYYPTRTEAGILARHAGEIVDGVMSGSLLVEFGSGSSLKTEILLDNIHQRVAYVPIDVSETALASASARLQRRYPGLDVRPTVADFSETVTLPPDLASRPKIGFFPGSTIGNLAPGDAERLLVVFGCVLGRGGRLLIGVDLKKDAHTLTRAYNDAAGVTAALNLNLLTRINRELRGNFDPSAFRHEAVYDPREGRVEMHLVSTRDQSVELCDCRFHFRDGESVHTENSYKYSVDQFQDLARSAGWIAQRVWTDAADYFSVHELRWPRR